MENYEMEAMMMDEAEVELPADPVASDPFLESLSQIEGGEIGRAAQDIVASARHVLGGPAVEMDDVNGDGVIDSATVHYDDGPDVTVRDLNLDTKPDIFFVDHPAQKVDAHSDDVGSEVSLSDFGARISSKRDDILSDIEDAKSELAYQERRVEQLTSEKADGWIVDNALWDAKQAVRSAKERLDHLEKELSYCKK